MSPLDRWSVGLSFMIKKVSRVMKVKTLIVLLYMKVDFNFANAIYFGQRMTEVEREHLSPSKKIVVKNSSSVEVSVLYIITL